MTDTDRPAPGGVEEFEAFVGAHQDMVYATAVRLLGNPAEAEDVAQTVFLRAFERFDTLANSPSAAGWLKTVARNACLNHLARYRSRWQSFDDVASGGALGARIASDSSPARDLEHADERQRLEDALRRLPDHQRVPLVLFHFEEASYEEIAAALEISIAKVKTDIHRGREALRNLLVHDAPGVRHGSR